MLPYSAACATARRTFSMIHALVVFFLDARRQFDGVHGLAHAFALIGRERFLIHHLQRVDLAQMQVRVDEGFGDKICLRVDCYFASPVRLLSDAR